MKPQKNILLLIYFIICSITFAQNVPQNISEEEIKKKGEQKLSTMSKEEIEEAVKKHGMTLDEAQAKANEIGIDLETYLRSKSATQGVRPEANTDVIKRQTTQVQSSVSNKSEVTKEDSAAQVNETEKMAKEIEIPKATDFGPGGLQYYGYNVFKADPKVFEPRLIIDDQYVIGENDIISISLWGELQSYNEYKVDEEGRIHVSNVGPIYIGGYTVEKAKKIVINAMGKAYSGLVKTPPTIFLDLSIARTRPLRVFIMGEVTRPGGYAVSSIANVFNSLFSAGGPKVSGSLRDVRVFRNRKVIANVDLYDYLLGTQKTGDLRLNDNDIIYIPLRGRTVGIKGAVLRSAYFELLPGENLKKLLELSGGIRSNFYLERIQIDRIIPFEQRKKGELERRVFDINFSEILLKGKDYELEDGDIVTIFPILDEKKNYVTIEGAVWRPGTYQLDRVSTLTELIKEADGLHPEAYLDRARIVRTYDNKRSEVFYINLMNALKGGDDNIRLEPRDNVKIFSIYEMLTGNETVTVEGAAKRPGVYPLHKNLTLYDLVYDAVGLTDTLFRKKIYLDRADLIRFNEDGYTTRIIPFNLWKLFNEKEKDTLLLPKDRIVIYPLTTVELKDRFVEISGCVKSPGRYHLSENATVLDIILQAGGYTEDAWTKYAEVSRMERSLVTGDSLVHTYYTPIPDLFDTSKVHPDSIAFYRTISMKLQHRDHIYIRQNPNYRPQKTVRIDGEVEHPGTYTLTILNERVSDIIRRAGGLKKSGYAEGGKLIRNNTRMRVNIAEAVRSPQCESDPIVQEGDYIYIPHKPFTIQVSGEVYNPGLFSVVDGKRLSYYLEQAGGETDSADFVLITYPDGMTEKVGLHWWSKNPRIPDGSVIYVTKIPPEPPEPPQEKPSVTIYDAVKDFSAILVSTLTILVLAKQLK